MSQSGAREPIPYYYAHVLEALRGRHACVTCGRGGEMSTTQIMDAIGHGREHTMMALHTAETDGHVTSRRQGKGYIWALVSQPAEEPCNHEAMRIIREVAAHHDVSMAALTEAGDRSKEVVRARTCAVHRLRHELSLTQREIAALVGLTSPSSVSYLLAKRPVW